MVERGGNSSCAWPNDGKRWASAANAGAMGCSKIASVARFTSPSVLEPVRQQRKRRACALPRTCKSGRFSEMSEQCAKAHSMLGAPCHVARVSTLHVSCTMHVPWCLVRLKHHGTLQAPSYMHSLPHTCPEATSKHARPATRFHVDYKHARWWYGPAVV